MSGPPDKFTAFTTNGMSSPQDFADALSKAYADGFNTDVVIIPSPTGPGNWVALGGYAKNE